MEETLNGLAELAELKAGHDLSAFIKACMAYDFADGARAFECTQLANRQLADQVVSFISYSADATQWLIPGVPQVSGASALEYADEVTGPVTGAVVPAQGLTRLQVREAITLLSCCGLAKEGDYMRQLLEEVERLQETEAEREVRHAA